MTVWLGLATAAAVLLGLWSPWPPASASLLAWPWVALLGFVVGRVTVPTEPPSSHTRPTPTEEPTRSWTVHDEIYGDPDV